MVLQPEYRKDIHGQYLIIGRDKYEETYDDRMLWHNRIEGHLSMDMERINDQHLCKYDVTGMESIYEKYAHGSARATELQAIFLGIFEAISKGKEYLLQEDDYVLDVRYCYLNAEKTGVRIMYFSGYREDVTRQLQGMAEFFMERVDYKDEKAVILIYGIYQMLKGERVTFQDLVSYVEGFQGEVCAEDAKEYKAAREEQRVVATQPKSDYVRQGESQPQRTIPRQRETGPQPPVFSIPLMEEKIQDEEEVNLYPLSIYIMAAGSVVALLLILATAYNLGFLMDSFGSRIDGMKVFGMVLTLGTGEVYLLFRLFDGKNKVTKLKEKTTYVHPDILEARQPIGELQSPHQDEEGQTVLLCEEERTVCLADSMISSCVLVSANPGEYKNLVLRSFPFLIGKYENMTEGVIRHTAISRYHARIEKKGEDLFLYDLHSTNGTYVNGERIRGNEGVLLATGDILRFADVDFCLER